MSIGHHRNFRILSDACTEPMASLQKDNATMRAHGRV